MPNGTSARLGRRPATLGAALLSVIVCAGPVHAQPASFDHFWRWVEFGVDDGLPSDEVASAIEVEGRVLWAATRSGLARFDGYRSSHVRMPKGYDGFPASMASDGRGGLLVVSRGRLLTGGAAGFRLLDSTVDGHDLSFHTCARASRGPVLILGDADVPYEWDGRALRAQRGSGQFGRFRSLKQAGSSGVWASTDRGLVQWNGESWELRKPIQSTPYELTAAHQSDDGHAWIYVAAPVEARGLWRWDRSRVVRVPLVLSTSWVTSLTRTPDGTVIAVHNTGEATLLQGDRWADIPTRANRVVDTRAVGLLADGDVWVATDHGLFVDRRSIGRWRFLSFPPPDGRNNVHQIVRGEGAVWAATAYGLVRIPDTGEPVHVTHAGSEVLASITGLAWDTQGRLWISSGDAFTGVRWLDRTGWHRLTADPLLDRTFVHKIVADRHGGVWFLGLETEPALLRVPASGPPGAFHLSADGRIARWGEPEGLLSGRVYGFAEAPDGAYWFATLGGISRWSSGSWRHWTEKDGLRSARVFALAVDRDGVAWFGHQVSGSGLGQVRDDRVRYVTAGGAGSFAEVWTVRCDALGHLWVAGNGGLAVFDGEHWTSFDSRSGLPRARIWPVLPDGDQVWFGMSGGGTGLLKLSQPDPPPVVSVRPPVVGSDSALMRWSAASWWGELARDDIPTRERLDEGPWSPWTTTRDTSVAQVSAGTHRVSVQAKGLLGTLGSVTTVEFTIEPPLVGRPVFYLPMAALAFIILGLVVRIASRQRRHRAELVAREERFRKAFQASPLSTSISDLETGQLLDVNDAFVRSYGWAREQLVGRSAWDVGLLSSDLDRAALKSYAVLPGARQGLSLNLRCKSGEVTDALAYPETIDFGGRQALLTQVVDVTERRRLEAQLRHVQKMDSVGRLAGGVAHDFNNLLTVIQGNAELLDQSLAASDPRHAEVDQITITTQRAARLTRQLLSFARRQMVDARILNLNDVIQATSHMLRRLIGEHIEVFTILAPEAAYVLADAGQIEQVIVNLSVNARDAMPGGGTLTIRTTNVELTEDTPRREPDTAPGPYVRLSVSDTGVGMDADAAARVFEPFFTTKDAGKGTGLGLATSYGIVKQAKGQITFDTVPQGGTTFFVDLPRASGSGVAAEAGGPPAALRAGHATVLLVEDETLLRNLAARMLRNRGYVVLEAADGPEALEVAAAHDAAIDVIVTDVVMPRMRGSELAERLRRARPSVKVLFISGYTDDDPFDRMLEPGRSAFLAKPFTSDALARALQALLDGGPQ